MADWTRDLRSRLDQLIDEYRASLHDCLDGLTEEEARLRLVPSKTTLLGLVKHATFVERVWFDQAVDGRSYAAIGIASTPDRSFTLRKSDTIAVCSGSLPTSMRRVPPNHRRVEDRRHSPGSRERQVWALQLQVLRGLAQHAGHSDILREQVLARRTDQ
jgi:hypothetical protein